MNDTELIKASDMGRVTMFDPQFKLPKFPLLSKHNVQIPMKEAILFDGSDSKQILRGKATQKFIPELLSYLDGKHSIQELMDILDKYPPKYIYDALSLLYSRGLLQERYFEDDNQPFIQYLTRHIDFTRVNASVDEAISKLKNTTLLIHCNNEHRTYIENILSNYPTPYDSFNPKITYPKENNNIALCICDNLTELNKLTEIDKNLSDQNIPWILILIEGSKLYIGPYFSKNATFCFNCFLHQVSIHSHIQEEAVRNLYLEKAGLAFTVSEIINLISRIGTSQVIHGFKEINMYTFETKYHHISRVPYCENCDFHLGKSPILNEVIEFESYVGFPVRDLINPKDHQSHYKPSNIKLATVTKDYPSLPEIELSQQYGLPQLGVDKQVSHLDQLASMLLYTVGFKRDEEGNLVNKSKRWAPTGGNLGSTNLYFINKSINSLPMGIYYYQVAQHSLAVLSNEQAYKELEENIGGAIEDDSLGYFIFTGNFEKVKTKYRDFAYRIINLDAGVALTQLNVIAQTFNKELTIHPFIDAFVEEYLGIEPSEEIVSLVVSLKERGNSLARNADDSKL